jgi:hypothetical protein
MTVYAALTFWGVLIGLFTICGMILTLSGNDIPGGCLIALGSAGFIGMGAMILADMRHPLHEPGE